MKRLAILLVIAACSGKAKPPSVGPGSGSGSAIYAKKISVAWGYQATGATTDVFLQTTDEAGNQVSYPLGTFQGACKTIRPDEAMKAITAASCTTGTAGVELDAVVQDEDIVI